MIVTWIEAQRGDFGLASEPDAVVWVSVALLEMDFASSEQWVGPRGTGGGQAGRYENIGQLIRSGRPIIMAHLILGPSGAMRFNDGRHRFAWVRDHGAEALPVTIDPAKAAALSARYATDVRTCALRCD